MRIVLQAYLRGVDGRTRCRLLGFERVELDPGEQRRVTLDVDPRLVASFDARERPVARWRPRRTTSPWPPSADRPGPTVGGLRLPASSFGS